MAFPSAPTSFNRWLIMRSIAILLSIASIGMLCSLLPAFDDWRFYGDGTSATFAGLPLAGNALTVLWNGIVLVLFFCRHAYHPGADIAMDFLGWGLNWAMGVMLAIWTAFTIFSDDRCDMGYNTVAVCSTAKRIDGIQWMAVVIALVVGTSHLALFVKACVDTHHVRISEQRSKHIELGGMNRA